MPQPSAKRLKLSLIVHWVEASHGYILAVHMNERKLLNNVMLTTRLAIYHSNVCV